MSGSDREVYVYRNATEIGRAAFGQLRSNRIPGSHVYTALATVDRSGRPGWMSTASVGGKAPDLKKLADSLSLAPAFLANVRGLIRPGTTLVLTSAPVSSKTQSSAGFNVLTARG